MGEIVEFGNIIDWLENDLYLIFISLNRMVNFWGLRRERLRMRIKDEIKIEFLY